MATMASCGPSELFDPIRKLWVAATPEEQVRQQWLSAMIGELGFPPALIAVEKRLCELPHVRGSVPDRRIDIACFAPGIHPEHPLYPLLLIECKAEAPTSAAVEQALGYNRHVQACFVAIAGGPEIRVSYFDAAHKRDVTLHFLPAYAQLIASLK